MLFNSLQHAFDGLLSLGDLAPQVPTCGMVQFGHVALDAALAVPQPVPGHMMQLCGPPAVGKTTLAMQAVAMALRLLPDNVCAWLNADHAFYEPYACALGVDMRRLLLLHPPAEKNLFGLLQAVLNVPNMRLLVVDAAECLRFTASASPDRLWRHLARLSVRQACMVLVTTQNHAPGVAEHAAVRLECLPAGHLYAGSCVVGQKASVHVARHRFSARRLSVMCKFRYDKLNMDLASSS